VGLEEGSDPGVIRTFLWKPSASVRWAWSLQSRVSRQALPLGRLDRQSLLCGRRAGAVERIRSATTV